MARSDPLVVELDGKSPQTFKGRSGLRGDARRNPRLQEREHNRADKTLGFQYAARARHFRSAHREGDRAPTQLVERQQTSGLRTTSDSLAGMQFAGSA
jgi:hypothetical protein